MWLNAKCDPILGIDLLILIVNISNFFMHVTEYIQWFQLLIVYTWNELPREFKKKKKRFVSHSGCSVRGWGSKDIYGATAPLVMPTVWFYEPSSKFFPFAYASLRVEFLSLITTIAWPTEGLRA